MGRRGSISPNHYWPGVGDLLSNKDDEILWKCVRANTYRDEKDKGKIRYALFLGRHPEMEAPIPLAVHDQSDPDLKDLLEVTDIIQRMKSGEYIEYTWADDTETWRSQVSSG
jgi:hypothetical protein